MRQLFFLFLLSVITFSLPAQPPTACNILWLKADAGIYTDAGVSVAANGQPVQRQLLLADTKPMQ